MNRSDMFRLEDRVLFDAAGAAEMVAAAESSAESADPNANVNEGERQAQEARNEVQNAPADNASSGTASEGGMQPPPEQVSDVDAAVKQLLQGDLPGTDADADSSGDMSMSPEAHDMDQSEDVLANDVPDDFVEAVFADSDTTFSTKKELVVINSSVPDKDAVLAEIRSNQDVLILSDGTGLTELQNFLDEHAEKYDAIHFVTHGNDGYFTVNGQRVDADNFDAEAWSAIGEHLSEDGDILLYGCNVAESDSGKFLVDRIAEASGADVAASTDVTGISGNWDLEYNAGLIETASIQVDSFEHDLAAYTIEVRNTNDIGANSLRAAITAGNTTSGEYTIIFTVSGKITLGSTLTFSNSASTFLINGDRDGDGISDIILDGGRVNNTGGVRILTINTGNTVTLNDLTLQNAYIAISSSNAGGGAIYNAGTLTLNRSSILNSTVANGSYASTGGGAIYNAGTLTVNRAVFCGNRTTGTSISAGGGAIYNAGTLRIENSTFYDNVSARGGGIYNISTLSMADSTMTRNSSSANGGAVYNQAGNFYLYNSIIAGNSPSEASCVGKGIYKNGGTISSYYSTIGSIASPTATGDSVLNTNIASRTGVDADDIFTSTSPNASGLFELKSSGVATLTGTLVGKIGADYHYYNPSTGKWSNGSSFDATNAATGYGLTGGTLLSSSQNNVSRTSTLLAFNAGSYAISARPDSLVVSTSTDKFNPFLSGVSLREAIATAALNITDSQGTRTVTFSGNHTILLNPELGEININSTLFTADKPLIIKGNGAANTTISGQDAVRIFNLAASNSLTLSGMWLRNGVSSANGGAVLNAGTLTLDNMTFSCNYASGYGGAVYNGAFLAVVNSTFYDNRASYGGAVSNTSSMSVADSTFRNNTASNNGGAIYQQAGTLSLFNSIVASNAASTSTYSGKSIFKYGGNIYAYYSIFGDIASSNTIGLGILSANVESKAGVAMADIYVDGTLTSEGVVAIRPDGVAALYGTLVGKVGTNFHYYNLATGKWSNGDTFDPTNTITYGLLGGTIISTSQNNVSRTSTLLAFNAGSYAIVARADGLVVTTATDKFNPFLTGVSLREAVATAGAKTATITFAAGITALPLSLGVIPVSGDVTLSSSVAISISGSAAANPIFQTASAKTLSFSGPFVLNTGILSGPGNFAFSGANSGSATISTTGSVTYSGTSAQTIYAGSCGALSITGSGAKTVSGTLNVTSFSVSGSSQSVFPTVSGSVAGTQINASSLALSNVKLENLNFGGKTITSNSVLATNTVTGLTIVLTLNDISTTNITYGDTLAGQHPTASGLTILGTTVGTLSFTDTTSLFNASDTPYAKALALTISSGCSSGYTTGSLTGNVCVARRVVTLTGASVANKVYDGTTAAAASNFAFTGLVSGQNLSLTNVSAAFASANVNGNELAQNVTIAAGYVLANGTNGLASNYVLANSNAVTITNAAAITRKTITLTGASVADKVYDGTAAAAASNFAFTGLVSGQNLSLTNVAAAFASANVNGNELAQNVTISAGYALANGTNGLANNYKLANTNAITLTHAAAITQKTVTLTGASVANKVYDGTAAAAASNFAFTGLVSGQNLSLTNVAAAFASANVNGNELAQNVTLAAGYALADGANGLANNYKLTSSDALTLTNAAAITRQSITLTGASVANKVYDGTTTASASNFTFSGLLLGQDLSLSHVSAAFANANVNGNELAQDVTIAAGYALENGINGLANNYKLTNNNTITLGSAAVITRQSVTLTGASVTNKVYDGTTTAFASGFTFSGLVSGESLSLSHVSASFANSHVNGNELAQDVTIAAGYALANGTNGLANNYKLANTSAVTLTNAAAITRQSITLTGASVANKVYDNSVAAMASDFVFSGIVFGEDLSLSNVSASFADKHVNGDQLAQNVTIAAGYVLADGTTGYANDYKLVNSNAVTITDAAIIQRADITLSFHSFTVVNGHTAPPLQEFTFNVTNGSLYDNTVVNAGASSLNMNLNGDYAIDICTLSNAGDYNLTLSPTGYVQVRDLPLLLVTVGSYSNSYDGSQHGVSFTVTDPANVLPSGYTIVESNAILHYSLNGQEVSGAPKNVGSYNVSVSGLKVLNNSGDDVTGVEIGFKIVTGTVVITPKTVTVTGINAQDKSYDGTRDATLDFSGATISGLVGSEILGLSATGTFSDINAAPGKTVSISQLTLSDGTGPNAGIASNYILATIGNQTETLASITPKEVTVSGIVAQNKTYDGSTTATLNFSGVTVSGTVGTETLIVGTTGIFSDKNAGTGKTVTLSPISFSDGENGGLASNYSVKSDSQGSTTADITPKEVTVSGILAQNKTYDGSTNATLDFSGATVSGTVGTETLTIGATGTFANKNAGNGINVALSGITLADGVGPDAGIASNYSVKFDSQGFTMADITPKEVTVSGIVAQNKTYDGSTTATLNFSGVTVSDLVGRETLVVVVTGEFSDKNTAAGKTVTLSPITLSDGIDGNGGLASNYSVKSDSQGFTTADITPKEVTVTGILAQNKTYDGSTSATLDFSGVTVSGTVGTETLVIGATGIFANKNAGNEIDVAISGITLADGTDGNGGAASNYILAQSGNQTDAKANITPKEITVTGILAQNKTYDGSTSATLDFSGVTLSGIVASETLSVHALGTFADKNAALGIAIAISDITLADGMGPNAGLAANYVLASIGNQNDASADITPKEVTVNGITAQNKTYDGSTTATLNFSGVTLSGTVGTETLNVSATGSFSDKNAAQGKIVSLSGFLLSDGTNGGLASNYTVATTGTQNETSADITPKEVTVSGITAQNKTYNCTADATLGFAGVLLSDTIDGETLHVSATGSFSDKNAGNGKTVTISGVTLSDGTGPDAGLASNYSVKSNSQTSTNADITPKEVTVNGITAQNKTYDGTADATLGFSGATVSGTVGGETLNISATGSFSDKNAGNGKTVTLSGLTLSDGTGPDAGLASNYSVKSDSQTSATADITPKEVTVNGITAQNKTYDDTTNATLLFAGVSGTVGTETLNVSATGSFSDKNAGNGKTVTISGITLSDGANGGLLSNYLLTNPQNQTSEADILPEAITIQFHNLSILTGDPPPQESDYSFTVTGNLFGEHVSGIGASTLDPNAVGRYQIDEHTLSNDQNFVVDWGTPAYVFVNAIPTIIVSVDSESATYNGATHSASYTLTIPPGTLPAGYTVDESGATFFYSVNGQVLASAPINVGTYSVTVSGIRILNDLGVDVTNTEIDLQILDGTIAVTSKAITVSGITAVSREFNGVSDTSIILDYSAVVYHGLVSGDSLSVSAVGTLDNGNAGANKTVFLSSLTLGNNALGNYVLASTGQQNETTVTVTPRPVDARWHTNAPYTANNSNQGATVQAYYLNLDGQTVNLGVTFSGTSSVFMNAGGYTATAHNTDPNYTLRVPSAEISLTMNPEPTASTSVRRTRTIDDIDHESFYQNRNYTSYVPAMEAQTILRTDLQLGNPLALTHGELVGNTMRPASMKLRLDADYSAAEPLGVSKTIRNLSFESAAAARGTLQIIHPNSISRGSELFPDDDYAQDSLSTLGDDSEVISVQGDAVSMLEEAWHFLQQPVKLLRSLFPQAGPAPAEGPDSTFPDPAYEIAGIPVELLPIRDNRFKNDVERLLDALCVGV